MSPCNNCPFVKSSPLDGAPDWLRDVLEGDSKVGFTHTCHKTDPKADGFKGSQKVRECVGYLTMRMNEIDKTPGKGGVWRSVGEMALEYIRHWVGIGLIEHPTYVPVLKKIAPHPHQVCTKMSVNPMMRRKRK